jgi:hypothetical protein
MSEEGDSRPISPRCLRNEILGQDHLYLRKEILGQDHLCLRNEILGQDHLDV